MPIVIAPTNTELRIVRVAADEKLKKTSRKFRDNRKRKYYGVEFRRRFGRR